MRVGAPLGGEDDGRAPAREGVGGAGAVGGRAVVQPREGVAGPRGCARQGDGGAVEARTRGRSRCAARGVEAVGVGRGRGPLGGEDDGRAAAREGVGGAGAVGGGAVAPAGEGVARPRGRARQGDGGAVEARARTWGRCAARRIEAVGVRRVGAPLGREDDGRAPARERVGGAGAVGGGAVAPAGEGVAGPRGRARQGDGGAVEAAARTWGRCAARRVEAVGVRRVGAPLGREDDGRAPARERVGGAGAVGGGAAAPAGEGVARPRGRARQGDGGAVEAGA